MRLMILNSTKDNIATSLRLILCANKWIIQLACVKVQPKLSTYRSRRGCTMDRADLKVAELSVSDYSQLTSLADYLRLVAPDVQVTRSSGQLEHGEQGALDLLMIAADSSVLVAALKVLPDFVRSRRAGMSVTVTKKDKQLTVTADNAAEVAPIFEQFMDD